MGQIERTLTEREGVHGNFEDNARISQWLKDMFRGQRGWPVLNRVQSEALDMIAGKIGRILSGDPNHIDHWHDIAGYATLVVKGLEKFNDGR